MKRRICYSKGLSRRAAARAAVIALVVGLGPSIVACSSDLFHDTKWQSRCDLDASDAICPEDGGGGGGGASATSSAGSTTSTSSGSASSTAGAGGAGGAAAISTGTTMSMASSSTG